MLIAAPAAVAVWSGWVGLGALCGFGLVQPLPGIVSWHLDTAITLPVGVEAYGAYALGAWLTPGTPQQARTFARRSAVGALVLGSVGQVVYHLLAAAHRTRAPWPVVMLVACLPVVTLGFGAALTHLLRIPSSLAAPPGEQRDDEPVSAPAAAPAVEPEAAEAAEPLPVPVAVLPPVPASAEHAAELAFRATCAAGNPLSGRQLEARFGLTRSQATKVRQRVLAEPGEGQDDEDHQAQPPVHAGDGHAAAASELAMA
jgi:hypothetical protein